MMTILRHDAQIRNLAEPVIEELGVHLASQASSQLH